MSLYIASRARIPHDDSPEGLGHRRMLALGRTKGGQVLAQVTARAGDFQATGTRKQEPGKTEAETAP